MLKISNKFLYFQWVFSHFLSIRRRHESTCRSHKRASHALELNHRRHKLTSGEQTHLSAMLPTIKRLLLKENS